MNPPEAGKQPGKDPGLHKRRSFLGELKKRQVYQAAGAYAVVAWGVTEILDGVISRFGWPDWLAILTVILFVTGFPVAMFLAWVFDWTPEGVRKEEPWSATGRVSIAIALLFLVAGSAGLFWLINPSGLVRTEQVGIGVLPCRYRGPDDFAFRAEGAAMAVSDMLAYVDALRVVEFGSLMKLSRGNVRTSELGDRAGLEWLVECRLVQELNSLRIDASLVEVQSDESSPLINLDVADTAMVTAMESVAQAVVVSLDIPGARQRPFAWNGRLTSHSPSLDAWLKGENALLKGTVSDLGLARALFRSAQTAPGFDLARVREAQTMILIMEAEPPSSERERVAGLNAIELMLDAAEAANPALAETYAARMRLEILRTRFNTQPEPDLAALRRWLRQALDLRPSYAEPYRLMGQALADAGKNSEAAELLELADTLSVQ
jgi:TolB-like protein